MLSKPITLFEYDRLNLNEEGIYLTARDVHSIVRLNQSTKKRYNLRKDVVKFSPDNHQPTHLLASSLVGVLKAGRNTIQILPKIAQSKDGADCTEESIRNLLYMLNFTKRLSIKEIDLASLRRVKDNFFEVLILLFARNLRDLLQQDMHREYVEREANLPYLKGRLKIGEHLRQNYVYKSRFFVQFDEFLEDNRLNQILKYTTHHLMRQSSNAKNKKLLQESYFLLSDITRKRITVDDFKKVHLSRLNEQYAPLLNLCKLFISQSSVELRSDQTEAFSFLFDMSVLFEEFIGEFIRRYFSRAYGDIRLQRYSAYLVEMVEEAGESKPTRSYSLKPDVGFFPTKSSKKPFLLLDTKYKKLSSSQYTYGVASDDMYQMCVYSLKYDCPDIIVLYPQEGDQSKRYTLVVNERIRVHVRTVDIMRDLRTQSGRNALRDELDKILQFRSSTNNAA